MIPIRDTQHSKNFPLINTLLIAINVAIFLAQLTQGGATDRFVFTYGLVPGRYTLPHIGIHFTPFEQVAAWISFMFLHGGFLHLLGNMWSLYIFGDNVEDRLGHLRYVVFYVLCGVVSGITHFLLNSHSTVPTIGASGAVAGVMGAYFLLHPKAKVLTLIPVLFIPLFVEIPALFFLGFWFLMQFINAAGKPAAAGGVAWWAHVGGFICGMICLKIFTWLPQAGLSERLRPLTTRKRTHHIQVARPVTVEDRADIHADIQLSPYEAQIGARKLVTVAQGLQRRAFRVDVPPGISHGKILRLRNQGAARPDGGRGDLLLRVIILSGRD
jgi:membrane associated rhomboid family serine protease